MLFRWLVTKHNPIIIAGLGGCGTTFLSFSLIPPEYRDNSKLSLQFADNLSDCAYKKGVIYKTHDYPNFQEGISGIKVIFMFGNIYNIIISMEELMNRRGREYFSYLKAGNFRPYEDMYYKDVLNLEKLFDAWYQPQKFPLITLKYEKLYNNDIIEKIRCFLGFKPDLPPYKIRQSNYITHPKKEIMQKVYTNLHKKIEHAEDAKIWNVL